MEGLSDEVCPLCKSAFITLPKKCEGTFNVANEGRYFQHCARHTFNNTTPCKYFYWNDTMQRRFGEIDSGPSNWDVDDSPRRNPDFDSPSRSIASTPTSRGQTSTPTSSSRQPRLPCKNQPCQAAGNANCVQLYCKKCCLTSPTHCVLDAQAYAKPVDPSYAAKLIAGDFKMNGAANHAAIYKKAQAHTIEVYWWAKCGLVPEYLESLTASELDKSIPDAIQETVAFTPGATHVSFIVNTNCIVYRRFNLDRNTGLTIDHIKALIRAHRGQAVRPVPRTLDTAVNLLHGDAIQVDWELIETGTEDEMRARPVEALMRILVGDGNIIVPPSPLSTPTSSRPGTAMSDVLPTSTIENVNNVEDSDVSKDQDSTMENLNNVEDSEVSKDQDTQSEAEAPRRPLATSWRGPVDDFDDSFLWEFVAYDPEVDVIPYKPKVIVLNYIQYNEFGERIPDQMHVRRLNVMEFRTIGTGPDEMEDRSVPESAFTISAFTRTLVKGALDHVWPGEVDFEVFWRLPGYDNCSEFGPLVAYRARDPGEARTTIWSIRATHTLPVLGPPEAGRVMLVIRECKDDDEEMEEELAPPPPPPAYTPNTVVHGVQQVAVPPGLAPLIPPPIPAQAPLPVPVAPVAPVVAAAQAGQNTFAINEETAVWLHETFGDYPLVSEIRHTDKRAQQQVVKLLEWAKQVYEIRAANRRVPGSQGGMAVGHIISLSNLGSLFLRSASWIKDAIHIHEYVIANSQKPQVAQILASGQRMGVSALCQQLTRLPV
ncbi:hypothetical protein B0H15DRAFT_800845 [Mycena belliarum]|uniref:Uncharacterized protein n=1 Tax=Mycena belliarum TaxID=1033014 RepID=A0AAD6U7T6_9AGAR|nr:hypothetical protein B0H15DRAFT_800845 [Mycena belliae]